MDVLHLLLPVVAMVAGYFMGRDNKAGVDMHCCSCPLLPQDSAASTNPIEVDQRDIIGPSEL